MMVFYMIDLFFIKTLEFQYLNKTLESFYGTLKDKDIRNFNIVIINELETRETTLNKIVKMKNLNNDLLIVADDIIFIGDWYKSLQNNLLHGDILGFTMITPKKNKIHNNGFDLIKVDNKLTYLPHMHSESIDKRVEVYRECDAIVGCAMYIKNDVLKKVKEFPKDGYNRWGELLFSAIAKQNKFKTIVLGHKLFHYSISSKQKKDVQLSSMSWLIEDKLWREVAKKYLNTLKNIPMYNNRISQELKSFFYQNKNILIYGCGTVTDIILKNIDSSNVEVASGLLEEIGVEFNTLIVKDVNLIHLDKYQFIVIGAIGYEDEIIQKYFPNNENIFKLMKIKNNNLIEIGIDKCMQLH